MLETYGQMQRDVCKKIFFVIKLMRIIDNHYDSIYNYFNVIKNLIVLAIRDTLLQYNFLISQIDEWREY